MGYVSTNISGVRLLIGGVDYSNELVTFNVSDNSLIGSTILQTTGDIELAQSPTGRPVNDYFNLIFPVGTLITLDVKQPNGEYIRHPRGFLYVISSSYNAEAKIMSLQVGCGLAVMLEYQESSLDIAKNLIETFIPEDLLFKLPPDERTVIGEQESIAYDLTLLANCLQAQGKAIYQDKWGYIQLVNIFGSTGSLVTDPAAVYKFTAYDTKTIISLESQSNVSQVAQTKIEFSYELSGTNDETTESTSEDLGEEVFTPYETDEDYYIANTCTSDNRSIVDPIETGATETSETRFRYGSNGLSSVQDKSISSFQAENPLAEFGTSPTFNEKVETETIRYYGGPGKQVDKEISYTTQNLLSTMPSIARDFAQVLIDSGQGPGGAPISRSQAFRLALDLFDGRALSSRSESVTFFGSGGEVIKTVQDEYKQLGTFYSDSYLVAYDIATRSNSFPIYIQLQLATRTITTYLYKEEYTEERTVTLEYNYNPDTIRESVEIRRSGNANANAIQADSLAGIGGSSATIDPVSGDEVINPLDPEATQLCPPENETTTTIEYEAIEGVADEVGLESGLSSLFSGEKFIPSIFGGGLNVPVMTTNVTTENYPLNYRPLRSREEEPAYRADIDEYARILHRKTLADRLGFTIQEAMRPEFYSWYPSMPYRLVLQSENKGFYMRISGSTWTLNNSEAICSFESMLIGTYTVSSISLPSSNQLEYLLPPQDSPTTANNQVLNHDTELANTVRSVTIGSPTPAVVPITTLPTFTSTRIVPSIPIANVVTFGIYPKMRIRLVTKQPISPNPAPIDVVFNIPVALSITSLNLNFGGIAIPSGSSLDFGTIRNPAPISLELGTINAPAI